MAVKGVIDGGGGVPQEPDWAAIFDDDLDQEIARATWRTAINELRDTEKLAPVNAHQIKRYAIACVQYDVAFRHVQEQGPVTLSKKGNQVYNLWWTVMGQAGDACAQLEAELTISPRRRNNGGKVTKKAKGQSAADSYLKPVSRS